MGLGSGPPQCSPFRQAEKPKRVPNHQPPRLRARAVHGLLEFGPDATPLFSPETDRVTTDHRPPNCKGGTAYGPAAHGTGSAPTSHHIHGPRRPDPASTAACKQGGTHRMPRRHGGPARRRPPPALRQQQQPLIPVSHYCRLDLQLLPLRRGRLQQCSAGQWGRPDRRRRAVEPLRATSPLQPCQLAAVASPSMCAEYSEAQRVARPPVSVCRSVHP